MTDAPATPPDHVEVVPNTGWDERIIVCRCAPTVDVFIVVTQRYVVLVDTLLNPQTAAELLEIARPHLTQGRHLLAINTHDHWDHAWGNQVFDGPDALHPAPIIATRRSAARLRHDFLAEMQQREPGRFDAVRLVPPNVLFDDTLTIDGGDLTLELFPTPGHAPDHVAIFIPQIRTLLAADAAEFPFPFPENAQALPALRESLARMVALEPQVALYCHASVSSGPDLLRQNIAYFDTLEARCRAALERGVPVQLAPEEDVAALVSFPFAEALPPDLDAAKLPDFYAKGHAASIRMMLEWLAPMSP